MRFHSDGPPIPDTLLERCDAGRVVFLCGAGVSLPSGMPSFVDLTQHVIKFFDPPADSDIMKAFTPWLRNPSEANVPLDQIFNLLHLEYGKDEVNALVTERLSAPIDFKNFDHKHDLIKRISSSPNDVPQIVTTNFDTLFEAGANGVDLVKHVPPAFPDLNFGSKIEGITYLHGRLVGQDSESHPYVLSSADFGRAYLSEGWATNFIRHLLERYTVVLVGYKAEDPPIKYLLQGLNHDGQYDSSRLYAFDRGLPEEIEVKWRDRGVTAIAYSGHEVLWRTMEAWAERADDPRRWRKSVIAKCQSDPKCLSPHERGQVAHVLRTVPGARLFAEADPAPHPEWVCVMDANIRSAKPIESLSPEAEVFDPRAAYGLDDDQGDISDGDRRPGGNNDNLLDWRDEDDNPHDFHRLSGRQADGHEATPKRLSHLIRWLGKSINSPVLAWWAIRQDGLHPRLLRELEWQVDQSKMLCEQARRVWNLIFEIHNAPRSSPFGSDWYDLKNRIEVEGWTGSVLRDFRRITTPQLSVQPQFGIAGAKPPLLPWEDIRLSDLGHFEVKLLNRHNEDMEIPDDLMPAIFNILEEQFKIASSLLEDIGTVYFPTPTCYPKREVDGEVDGDFTDTAEVVTWFVQLFDRMAVKWPELAKAHATIWPSTDKFYFRKLKLHALSKIDVFDANHAAEEVLSLDQEAFWDDSVVRELLFLLADRWGEYSQENRNQLTDRILAGPDQCPHWSNEKFVELRDWYIARYARYLELKGCKLELSRSARLAEIINGFTDWNDGWASSTVVEAGTRGGWIGRDETPDTLLDLPASEVASKALKEMKRDFDSFTDKRPFAGLVKANPRKALSALTIAGKSGNYPEALWSSMIEDLPSDIPSRLRRVFLNRLVRLPHAIIVELRYVLSRWLKENLVAALGFNGDLGWAVYDHIVDGILSGGVSATKSSLGEVRQGEKVIQRSRRTFDHAINGPIGMCAQALFKAAPGDNQESESLIPDYIKTRVERLFDVPGEGADHAVSITSSNLNWLMFVDPAWTEKQLIPMLDFEHPASEPAWNGFLHSHQVPSLQLVKIIKPNLLSLFPWLESFSWDRDYSKVAAKWLCWLRVVHSDKPGGLFSGLEMRSALRAMSDETRNQFIFWLGQIGQKNDNGWIKHVIPLINECWPRERRYRTAASMRAWIGLLDDTSEDFPAVYDAVKKFVVPVETNDSMLYRFTRGAGDEKSITAKFPKTTLDLINRITPQVLTRSPYDLRTLLTLIEEVEPELTSDSRYLRLIDLVERS